MAGFSSQNLMAIPEVPAARNDQNASQNPNQSDQISQDSSNNNTSPPAALNDPKNVSADSVQPLSQDAPSADASTYPPGYEADGLENQKIMQAFKEKSDAVAKIKNEDPNEDPKAGDQLPVEDPNAPDYELKTQNMDGKIITLEYSKGLKTGVTTIINNDGIVEMKANFTKNILDGQTQYYYPDGALQREMNFSQGNLDGLMTSFNAEGGKMMEVEYKQGLMDGKSISYDDQGQIHVISNYKQGVQDGEMTIFTNGQVYLKKIYKNGVEVK